MRSEEEMRKTSARVDEMLDELEARMNAYEALSRQLAGDSDRIISLYHAGEKVEAATHALGFMMGLEDRGRYIVGDEKMKQLQGIIDEAAGLANEQEAGPKMEELSGRLRFQDYLAAGFTNLKGLAETTASAVNSGLTRLRFGRNKPGTSLATTVRLDDTPYNP